MGPLYQQGRYRCASFYDPNLLRDPITNEECSLEERRCAAMKPIWNRQMEEKEQSESNMEEDDMMMTMNVGRILYNKHNGDLSIPSTIKEEPSSVESNIQTDVAKNKNNRKRKTSDEGFDELPEEPSKKRFKFNNNNGNFIVMADGDHTNNYNVFDELTVTNYTNTIGSHIETPMRRLDFATPGSLLLSKQKQVLQNRMGAGGGGGGGKKQVLQERSNAATIEQTQDIGSMTEFFKNPIKITDKRMADTPTVKDIKCKKMINPTATITFHSKAAMNDIVEIFGDGNDDGHGRQNSVHEHVDSENYDNNNGNYAGNNEVVGNAENVESFGIYEDTATIHTKIDIGKIEIVDDEDDVPQVGGLSIDNENESTLPLPIIAESDDDENNNDKKMENNEENEINQVMIIDPFDIDLIKNYSSKLLQKYIGNNSNIIDQRDDSPPVSIDELINGETDIELDDDNDVFLNVTEYIKSISCDIQHIFFVNDLSQDEDCERMLVIDQPLSLKSYHITQIIKEILSPQIYPYLSMEYAMVESVYLYNNSSFTLSKITEKFVTLKDVLLKYKSKHSDLHEKLSLYYVTEIIRMTYQLHECNIVHSNLSINSFVVKMGSVKDINGDWTDKIGNGWQNFGLMLNDLNSCIKLDEFIDFNGDDNGNV